MHVRKRLHRYNLGEGYKTAGLAIHEEVASWGNPQAKTLAPTRCMKLFVKILGGILHGFILLLLWSMYLGGIIGSIYGIFWIWQSPEHDLETKVFVTSLCVIGFFAVLAMVYCMLDEHVNPRQQSWWPPSKPILPTRLKTEKKSKPILGDNKLNRLKE